MLSQHFHLNFKYSLHSLFHDVVKITTSSCSKARCIKQKAGPNETQVLRKPCLASKQSRPPSGWQAADGNQTQSRLSHTHISLSFSRFHTCTLNVLRLALVPTHYTSSDFTSRLRHHTWLSSVPFQLFLSVSPVDKSVPTGQEARISSQQPNFCSNTNIYTPAKLMFQHKFDLEQHQEEVIE